MKNNNIQPTFPVWLGAAAVFLLAFAVYWPVVNAGFVWDDNAMVKENQFVRAGNGLFSIWFSTGPVDYFPLTYTSLWLEWRLWGTNASGYHITNLLLHAANGMLLWRLLARLKIPGAWFAALLFLVHPVNVESVAWIAERKNTLSMFFYLLTFLFFLRFDETSQRRFYIFALIAFLFSLLSKTSGVMLPFVLLGVVWWQQRKIGKNDLLRSLPFFVLSLAMGLVTIWFQNNRVIGGETILSGWTRLAAAGHAVWFYLGKGFFPINLTLIYPQWNIDPRSLFSYLPGIAFIALAFLFWHFRNSWARPFFFAFGYFVLALFPVLGFFKMYFYKFSFVADHWQYIALPAVVALIGACLHRFPNILARNCFSTILIAGFAFLAWQQTRIYRDEETLWRDTLEKNPGCWLACNNLALLSKKKGRLDEAMDYNKRSLQIRPNQVEAHNNLGVLFFAQGKLDEAMVQYQAALMVNPGFADTHANIGCVLDQRRQRTEALSEFYEALRLNPNHTEAHNNLGCLLLLNGQTDEAILHFRTAVKLKPDSADSLANLGGALLQKGRTGEAINYLNSAIEINSDHANAHLNLGHALRIIGKFSGAIAQYDAALQIKPDLTAANYEVGNLLFRSGKMDEAIERYAKVLAQQPDSAEAHYRIATAFAATKRKSSALEHFREAVRLKPNWVEALNNLAWMLATDSKSTVHDGFDAVEFAERAAKITGNKEPATLDTLAVSYARAEQFPEAIVFSQTAHELASAAGQTNLASQIQMRLELYREKHFYQEP